ncbi:hypothetical protein, partial [Mycobacteroides abscessus]|uniref:hypothetical protein n=1 Tax=Mycobacteroides abscessus TaxID=36809 RepID=UPI001A98A7C7
MYRPRRALAVQWAQARPFPGATDGSLPSCSTSSVQPLARVVMVIVVFPVGWPSSASVPACAR